jgi:hypothetical protein
VLISFGAGERVAVGLHDVARRNTSVVDPTNVEADARTADETIALLLEPLSCGMIGRRIHSIRIVGLVHHRELTEGAARLDARGPENGGERPGASLLIVRGGPRRTAAPPLPDRGHADFGGDLAGVEVAFAAEHLESDAHAPIALRFDGAARIDAVPGSLIFDGGEVIAGSRPPRQTRRIDRQHVEASAPEFRRQAGGLEGGHYDHRPISRVGKGKVG